MARANAKRADAPTIAVILQQGRLVPASAFDRELLDQWREGTVLNIEAVRAKVPPLEKKYFAELTHLLKAAETPWSNRETAHEALKLATGFVTPVHRKTGEWGRLSRHIASFTDQELSEYYDLFCGIVQKRFGIDPETLQREASNSDTISSGADADANAADDGPSDRTIPPVAGEPSPDASASGEPAAGGEIGTPRKSPPAKGIAQLTDEDMFWLRQTARMLVAASGEDRSILDNQRRAIKANWTPASISVQARAMAKQVYDLCVDGRPSPNTMKVIAHLAGCTVEDLRSESR
jgi:hypothetical protein